MAVVRPTRLPPTIRTGTSSSAMARLCHIPPAPRVRYVKASPKESQMQQTTKIAVAGATGRLGRHVVDILESRGYDAVPISRSHGIDVITGEGLDQALTGV